MLMNATQLPEVDVYKYTDVNALSVASISVPIIVLILKGKFMFII